MADERSAFVKKHIVRCPHCGAEALDHMTECPKCKGPLKPAGYREMNPRVKRILKIVGWVVLGAAAVAIVVLISLRA